MENLIIKNGRVWADGCYDMSHFGHANSLRQAKKLGDYLIVGVHSDKDITKHKGTQPVFTQEERYAMVRAIKWVDEVAEGAPYVTTLETLDKHGCQCCAHGNDITTTANGEDTYQKVKDAGRYKEVERSQGVSTTELINRMLKLVQHEDTRERDNHNNSISEQPPKLISPYTGNATPLILTTQKMKLFSGEGPKPTDKIVYVAGAFDILHMGHLKFLEKAASLGDYLIVGLHSDQDVNSYCESKYPLMTLNERALNVLGCKFVQDIVIGAPLHITAELLDHLNISMVVYGTTGMGLHFLASKNVYSEPEKRDILKQIDSGSTLTARDIVERIRERREEYEERNRKKEAKEAVNYAAEQKRREEAQRQGS